MCWRAWSGGRLGVGLSRGVLLVFVVLSVFTHARSPRLGFVESGVGVWWGEDQCGFSCLGWFASRWGCLGNCLDDLVEKTRVREVRVQGPERLLALPR